VAILILKIIAQLILLCFSGEDLIEQFSLRFGRSHESADLYHSQIGPRFLLPAGERYAQAQRRLWRELDHYTGVGEKLTFFD
jgi:hypothetical protein